MFGLGTKKYILFKIWFLILFQVVSFAKTIEILTPVIGDELALVRGKLVPNGLEEKKLFASHRHALELKGTVKTTTIPGFREKIIQILWTNVLDANNEYVLLEPFLSTISSITVNVGDKMGFKGDLSQIGQALVSSSSSSNSQIKKEAKTPKTTARSVLIPIIHGSANETTKQRNEPKKTNDANTVITNMMKEGDSQYKNNISLAKTTESNINSSPGYMKDESIDFNGYYNHKNEKHTKINENETSLRKQNKHKKNKKEENIRVEVTSQGCKKKIDFDNDRIIIRNKTITYKSDKIQSETQCTDSLEHYLIKKDFVCDKCRDIINIEEGFACPTFERYWTGSGGEKIVLSSSPELDETQKFPIKQEEGNCPPYIDIEYMQAFSQFESVYYNRVNARIVAKTCRRTDNSKSAAINYTNQGCAPTHNFDKGWSILKKKGFFSLNGKKFIAFDCKEVGRPIIHSMDPSVCKNNINLSAHQILAFGKRYIEINGIKNYLGDCEPLGKRQVLQLTTKGCDGQFVHVQDEKRSYIKKRWYYNDGLDMQFVTPCIKSTEFIKHTAKVIGFEHDDATKTSKRIADVFIEYNKTFIVLYKKYIDHSLPAIPYTLEKKQNESTKHSVFEGCYKITQTNTYGYYMRPDKSVYKLFEGMGTPIKSKNLCVKTVESRDEYAFTKSISWLHHSMGIPNNWLEIATAYQDIASECKNGIIHEYINGKYQEKKQVCMRFYQKYQRQLTVFPNSQQQHSNWIKYGEVFAK